MRRWVVAGLGLGAAALYVTGSWVTAHVSGHPVPLLDGLAPPPNYRYVETPPRMAPSKEPFAGSFSVPLGRQGSNVYAFATKDQQVSLTLASGAIPTLKGARRVRFSIEPLGPSNFPAPPSGQSIDGNVYRITAVYQPGEAPIRHLARPLRLHLAYPAEATTKRPIHALLYSPDGRTWRDLHGTDYLVGQSVRKRISSLGYFAVAGPPTSTSSTNLWEKVGGVLTIVVVIALIVAIFRSDHHRRGAS